MNRDLLLGIDVGTTTVKVLAVDPTGRVVARSRAVTPFATVGAAIEMTEAALFRAVHSAVDLLAEARPNVVAVGLASIGEAGVPLSEEGAVRGPLIAWHDPRGAEVAARLQSLFGSALPARAGQATRSQSSIAKIGWFVEHGVEVHRWLGVSELCLRRLSGAEATEPSLACRTGAYDITAGSFMSEVLKAVGAPDSVFPSVLVAGTPHGVVNREGAEWLGLRRGLPVTIAGHDHMVGAAGVGLRETDLLDSIGTAETLVRYASDSLDIARAVEMGADVSLRPSVGGMALMIGDLRPGPLIAAAARALGGLTPDRLDELALSSPAAIEGRPFLARLQAGASVDVRDTPPGPLWRGLIEAMAGYTGEVALRLDGLAPFPERVVVIGGGASSRLWVESKRRLWRLPVVRWEHEAVAYGAAMLAGCAAGFWPSLLQAPRPELMPVD